MINYKYSLTEALNNSSSSSSIGHHKRSNSVHLQQSSPQQQLHPTFERKNSQESSVVSLSDRSITSPISSLPTTPQDHQNTTIRQRMSEPIIDLNKITEEYNNCQRRLSIASMKKANESLVHWCQFLQEEEDTRFYSQELNQDGLNSSSSVTNLPITSEILLESFNEHKDDDDNNKQEGEGEDKKEEMPRKHNNIQLIRNLSRITRKNSLSMLKSSRKSTASV